MSRSHRADNTSLAQRHPAHSLTHLASSPSPPPLVPTEISSFLLHRIICTDFPQTTTASIAFFSVSLARPALPLLPITFSPSKDSRRGSSRGITVQVSYDELEFSVTRRDVYGTHVRGRSQSLLNIEAVLNSVSFATPTWKQPAGRKADCGLIDFSGKKRIIRQHLRKFYLSFVV